LSCLKGRGMTSIRTKTDAVSLSAQALSIETKLLLFFAIVWASGLTMGLPVNIPDVKSYEFIEKHYFRPFFIASVLDVTLLISSKFVQRPKDTNLLALKLFPFVICTIFIHFNFKAWMPLINPHQYDHIYQQIDIFFEPLLTIFFVVRQSMSSLVPLNLDFLYHNLFIAMFYGSFTAHVVFDRPTLFRQLVLSTCLILLLGGLCYWIAPAEGAYLYRIGINAESTTIQKYMHLNFEFVKKTGIFPPGYFTNAPAAMPSLHIAHALMFTFFIWRSLSLRWLLLLYVPATFWLIIDSVCSGWHYLIDLPAGALLCFICVYSSMRLLDRDETVLN